MIGLLVQLTAEFAKIWSVSYHRLITYIRDDIPNDIHEGDWVDIKFDTSGVMKGIFKENDFLKTKRNDRGKLQVLDIFIVDSCKQVAFCETFGSVRIEQNKDGEIWAEERRTKDHCIIMWMTISSKAQFSIEEQSLDRANSKDGKYSETYKKLMDQFEEKKYEESREEQTDEYGEFDEMILIVGFDPRANVYFSASRSGEAFIYQHVWKSLKGDDIIEKGAVFRARLNKQLKDPMHKVVHLYARVDVWEGVQINSKDMAIELNGEIVERRQTCFALDTEPFGLVTYPFEDFLDNDIHVGDHLRVVVYRHKIRASDYPSKWRVTKLVEMLKKAGKKSKNEWFEGVVTSVYHTYKTLITFKLGSAMYKMNGNNMLSLGDIVDIRVVPNTQKDGFYNIVDMGDEIRRREDLIVEPFEQTKCNVFCKAKVIEHRDTYFLLDTPIIGLVLFFRKEAPRKMEVGDVWRIKMLRRKDKKEYPSYWVATSIVGEFPQVSSISSRMREEEYEKNAVEYTYASDYSTKDSIPSTSNSPRDNEWITVIITGSDTALWYGTCAQADTIRIAKKKFQYATNLEKGAFHRVKIAKARDGATKAIDLDPNPIYPKDVEVNFDNHSIQVWCYSRIVEVHTSSFTVYNDLIGDATLPFNKAEKGMQVGDKLETLYYRVTKTSNPTKWMVREAKFAKGNECYKEGEYCEREKSYIEEKRTSENYSVYEEPLDNIPVKDRRVIDLTRRFMLIPEIREKFMRGYPETLKKIEKIIGNSNV